MKFWLYYAIGINISIFDAYGISSSATAFLRLEQPKLGCNITYIYNLFW